MLRTRRWRGRRRRRGRLGREVSSRYPFSFPWFSLLDHFLTVLLAICMRSLLCTIFEHTPINVSRHFKRTAHPPYRIFFPCFKPPAKTEPTHHPTSNLPPSNTPPRHRPPQTLHPPPTPTPHLRTPLPPLRKIHLPPRHNPLHRTPPLPLPLPNP